MEGYAARGELYLLVGLFRVAMRPRIASSDKPKVPKGCLNNNGINFRPISLI